VSGRTAQKQVPHCREKREADRRADRDRLADLAYDAIVETSLDIQTVPVSLDEWEHPEHYTNPALIRAIKRDGVVVEAGHDPRPAQQSVPFS
jgi:hypothetical protein